MGQLLDHFVRQLTAQHGVPAPTFPKAVRARLTAWRWPGNVRELRNLVEQLCLLRPGARLEVRDLPAAIRGAKGPDTLKLPPASSMSVDLDGRRSDPAPYWDLSFAPRQGLSDAEWEERAIEVFRESVEAHLVADVPFGVFLSGGVDSTLVAG